jgi:hypothetical protein
MGYAVRGINGKNERLRKRTRDMQHSMLDNFELFQTPTQGTFGRYGGNAVETGGDWYRMSGAYRNPQDGMYTPAYGGGGMRGGGMSPYAHLSGGAFPALDPRLAQGLIQKRLRKIESDRAYYEQSGLAAEAAADKGPGAQMDPVDVAGIPGRTVASQGAYAAQAAVGSKRVYNEVVRFISGIYNKSPEALAEIERILESYVWALEADDSEKIQKALLSKLETLSDKDPYAQRLDRLIVVLRINKKLAQDGINANIRKQVVMAHMPDITPFLSEADIQAIQQETKAAAATVMDDEAGHGEPPAGMQPAPLELPGTVPSREPAGDTHWEPFGEDGETSDNEGPVGSAPGTTGAPATAPGTFDDWKPSDDEETDDEETDDEEADEVELAPDFAQRHPAQAALLEQWRESQRRAGKSTRLTRAVLQQIDNAAADAVRTQAAADIAARPQLPPPLPPGPPPYPQSPVPVPAAKQTYPFPLPPEVVRNTVPGPEGLRVEKPPAPPPAAIHPSPEELVAKANAERAKFGMGPLSELEAKRYVADNGPMKYFKRNPATGLVEEQFINSETGEREFAAPSASAAAAPAAAPAPSPAAAAETAAAASASGAVPPEVVANDAESDVLNSVIAPDLAAAAAAHAGGDDDGASVGDGSTVPLRSEGSVSTAPLFVPPAPGNASTATYVSPNRTVSEPGAPPGSPVEDGSPADSVATDATRVGPAQAGDGDGDGDGDGGVARNLASISEGDEGEDGEADGGDEGKADETVTTASVVPPEGSAEESLAPPAAKPKSTTPRKTDIATMTKEACWIYLGKSPEEAATLAARRGQEGDDANPTQKMLQTRVRIAAGHQKAPA